MLFIMAPYRGVVEWGGREEGLRGVGRGGGGKKGEQRGDPIERMLFIMASYREEGLGGVGWEGELGGGGWGWGKGGQERGIGGRGAIR